MPPDAGTDAATTRRQEQGNVTERRTKDTSRKRPLHGKIVSVSAVVDSNTQWNYKRVTALCEAAGAKCSSQVHKKVFCVVATVNAIDQETQRVRKAWKREIPVLRLEWLQSCLREQSLIPMEDYEVQPPGVSRGKKVKESKPTQETEDAMHTIEERKVDLGCCCVCHELQTTDDCEWCVDCRTSS